MTTNNDAMAESDQPAEETRQYPDGEYLYNIPFGSDWMHCPSCGSGSVLIKEEASGTAWFQKNTVVWLECGSCRETSAVAAGDPIAGPHLEQPNSGLLQRIKGWFARAE
jgi:hypothetical protein